MKKTVITTSLEEDLKGLGISMDEDQIALSGVLTEESDGDEQDEGCDTPGEKKRSKGKGRGEAHGDGKGPIGVPVGEKGKGKGEDEDEEEEEDEEGKDKKDKKESNDALDGPDVTPELFERIMALPFDNLEVEDVEELLEKLKGKNLPKDNEALKESAEKVVKYLLQEVAAKRQRRFKAGKVSKKKSFQCPPGTRQDPKNPRRCVRAAKAAGGAGELHKERRKKKLWGRTGAGKKSERKSERVSKRRHTEEMTPSESFARELGTILEERVENTLTVRDELMERIQRIFIMLCEEFENEAVTEVFEEAFEPLVVAWDSGRLDEDVMEVPEFMGMIEPALTLIHKSIDRLDREDRGELGNG